jgi:hypothetical protein
MQVHEATGGTVMKRIHLVAAAALIGVAAMLGLFAVTRTAGLGASARQQSAAQVAATEAALRRRLAGGKSVVHVRPAPIVVHDGYHDD